MYDINTLDDLSILTKVPKSTLKNIFETLEKEIGHQVYNELILSEKASIILDIGIGELVINLNSEEEFVTYDFIPSKSLEKDIIQTLTAKESPLVRSIEKNLESKILSLYKELV